MLSLRCYWNLSALIDVVHFLGTLPYNVTQSWSDFYFHPMANLSIEECTICHMYGVHFLQTHSLSSQLHFIHFILLWLSVLVFHRYRNPMSRIFGMQDGIRNIFGWKKFYSVADAIESQFMGCDMDISISSSLYIIIYYISSSTVTFAGKPSLSIVTV